jgi:hypothetical protein
MELSATFSGAFEFQLVTLYFSPISRLIEHCACLPDASLGNLFASRTITANNALSQQISQHCQKKFLDSTKSLVNHLSGSTTLNRGKGIKHLFML